MGYTVSYQNNQHHKADVIQTGSLYSRGLDMAGHVYNTNGLSLTFRIQSGENDIPCVISDYFKKDLVLEYANH